MIHVAWDRPAVHGQLARLIGLRMVFRVTRSLQRIRSTRRWIATSLTAIFLIGYLLSGIFILATRPPADPERLRLWLSGGMAIYLIYHLVRCVWNDSIADLELTPAESLWLGSAPVQRSTLAVYQANNVVIESLLKAALLSVILARDVNHIALLMIGLVSSFVLLHIGRLVAERWVSGLDVRRLKAARWLTSLVAVALLTQVLARLLVTCPLGSPAPRMVTALFGALGETAASEVLQWLSLAWWPASSLIITDHYRGTTAGLLVASALMIPAGIWLLVHVDAWVMQTRERAEQQRFAKGDFHSNGQPSIDSTAVRGQLDRNTLVQRWLPRSMDTLAALIDRQVITATRYRATLLFSFVVPTALCLSPLLSDRVPQQWMFIVGGIALCTLLLAPPALQIDFRRDLKRMLLLRSLPVRPSAMVAGQLATPIAITLLFQWLTILIAAHFTQPAWPQVAMWTGMLAALAIFTFAMENALFLTFPHHQHRQGMAMMIRAKLVFLGKVVVIICSLATLLWWTSACGRWFPESCSTAAMITAPIAATWTLAAASVAITTWCWQRFDLERDIPPQ